MEDKKEPSVVEVEKEYLQFLNDISENERPKIARFFFSELLYQVDPENFIKIPSRCMSLVLYETFPEIKGMRDSRDILKTTFDKVEFSVQFIINYEQTLKSIKDPQEKNKTSKLLTTSPEFYQYAAVKKFIRCIFGNILSQQLISQSDFLFYIRNYYLPARTSFFGFLKNKFSSLTTREFLLLSNGLKSYWKEMSDVYFDVRYMNLKTKYEKMISKLRQLIDTNIPEIITHIQFVIENNLPDFLIYDHFRNQFKDRPLKAKVLKTPNQLMELVREQAFFPEKQDLQKRIMSAAAIATNTKSFVKTLQEKEIELNKELYFSKVKPGTELSRYAYTKRPITYMYYNPFVRPWPPIFPDIKTHLFLPIVRYERLYYSQETADMFEKQIFQISEKSDFKKEQEQKQFCGRFYYFEPSSELILDLGPRNQVIIAATKVDAMKQLFERFAMLDEKQMYQVLKVLDQSNLNIRVKKELRFILNHLVIARFPESMSVNVKASELFAKDWIEPSLSFYFSSFNEKTTDMKNVKIIRDDKSIYVKGRFLYTVIVTDTSNNEKQELKNALIEFTVLDKKNALFDFLVKNDLRIKLTAKSPDNRYQPINLIVTIREQLTISKILMDHLIFLSAIYFIGMNPNDPNEITKFFLKYYPFWTTMVDKTNFQQRVPGTNLIYGFPCGYAINPSQKERDKIDEVEPLFSKGYLDHFDQILCHFGIALNITCFILQKERGEYRATTEILDLRLSNPKTDLVTYNVKKDNQVVQVKYPNYNLYRRALPAGLKSWYDPIWTNQNTFVFCPSLWIQDMGFLSV